MGDRHYDNRAGDGREHAIRLLAGRMNRCRWARGRALADPGSGRVFCRLSTARLKPGTRTALEWRSWRLPRRCVLHFLTPFSLLVVPAHSRRLMIFVSRNVHFGITPFVLGLVEVNERKELRCPSSTTRQRSPPRGRTWRRGASATTTPRVRHSQTTSG